jgi:pilus assembly protein TadC
MISMLLVFLIGAFVAWRGRLLLASRRRWRELAYAQAVGLPLVVTVLQIAIASGQTPRGAIGVVSELAGRPGALSAASASFVHLNKRLRLGADLDEAILSTLATTPASSSLARTFDALRRAELDGAPLQLHLELLGQDLRRRRSTELDTAAQRLTVSLLFPLVVCILPAFVLLAVVPLLLSALAGLPG